MSTKKNKSGLLIAAVLWLLIIGGLAATYKLLIAPKMQEDLEEKTSSKSGYTDTVRLQLDSFSGYAVFRSDALRKILKQKGIRLTTKDDKADIFARFEALQRGKADLAVFTVDSYLLAGAKEGTFPSSIISVIDESKGADAIVSINPGIQSIQDLNDPKTRIFLTPDSPSEFLAGVIQSHFDLPDLSKDWKQGRDGAGAVFQELKNDSRQGLHAYVLWEPYVSMARDEGAKVLMDSSKLHGFIVDVLVANRSFLNEKSQVVEEFMKSYFQALYEIQTSEKATIDTLKKDAIKTGSPLLTEDQARSLSRGIDWRNTLANYAHFGVRQESGIVHIEDIMINISEVLTRTGAIKEGSLPGQFSTLFYDGVLAGIRNSGFHPGDGRQAGIKKTTSLGQLSDAQWAKLNPVGEMKLRPIRFGRGSSRINVKSQRDLEALAKKLKAWPRYYLLVRGHTRSDGDPDANRRLASSRANAALEALLNQGISRSRLKSQPSQGKETGVEPPNLYLFF